MRALFTPSNSQEEPEEQENEDSGMSTGLEKITALTEQVAGLEEKLDRLLEAVLVKRTLQSYTSLLPARTSTHSVSSELPIAHLLHSNSSFILFFTLHSLSARKYP